ncbi:MAG: 30S ribosomal protein S4 [Candidatus Absconditabacterales bacterium]|nr:30S ribosomal protein S4 [Candidatus Absconditabacterales bacterium]
MPGQHGAAMQRLSDYAKLLYNKQALKKTYGLTEKQFAKLVKFTSKSYAKNNNLSHDVSLMQFLERRCDVVLFRSGIAATIMQARQMITHGHWLLDGKKHNIPSTFLMPGQTLTLQAKYQDSGLYQQVSSVIPPVYISHNKAKHEVVLQSMPIIDPETSSFDILKVIEFYARA